MSKSLIESQVLLQAFNWNSWRQHNKSYYKYIQSQSQVIKDVGINGIWIPPCSKSVSPQGYMPLDLYNLNSEYGTEDELKELIKVFTKNDIDVYGDVVINHRCAEFQNSNGVYNVFGGKLAWDDKAIVANDTKFQGKGNLSNYKLFNGAPNIDHSQENIQKDIIDWITWLKNDIGFHGFRFDYMTGIDPSFMKLYFECLDDNVPVIGEFWDDMNYENCYLKYDQNYHRQRIIDWIDNTGKSAFAFDVTTKGILQEAILNKEYWRLADAQRRMPGVAGLWKQRSITFIDNHDTHADSQNWWPFLGDKVEGYAYLLTHPGIPMIFCDEFFSKKLFGVLKTLVLIRKKYNITSNSCVNILEADNKKYVAEIDKAIRISLGDDININKNDKIIFKNKNTLIEEINKHKET